MRESFSKMMNVQFSGFTLLNSKSTEISIKVKKLLLHLLKLNSDWLAEYITCVHEKKKKKSDGNKILVTLNCEATIDKINSAISKIISV